MNPTDTPRTDNAELTCAIDGNFAFLKLGDFARQLERELNETRSALQLLYDETADYIRINHLGDVHHNRSMQMARDALKGKT